MPKSADIILQPHRQTVVLVEPYGPGFAELLEKLVQDPHLQVIECVSSMDTLSVVRQVSGCVIVAHARTGGDALQHITILKTLATQIQQLKSVRMMVSAGTFLPAEFVEKLTLHGCVEIIPDTLPAKALAFKVERHLKVLGKAGAGKGRRKSAVQPGVSPGARGRAGAVAEAEDREEAPEGDSGAAGVRLMPALTLPQDCWCLGGGGARGVGGAWQIKLRGHRPDRGRWLPNEKGDQWHWRPDDRGSLSVAPSVRSGWVFSGSQRPEFRGDLWVFQGGGPGVPPPSLDFYDADALVGSKLRVNERGTLEVAADSDAAAQELSTDRGQLWHVQNTGRANAAQPAAASATAGVAAVGGALDPADTAPQGATEVGTGVVFVDPLELRSDFWVIDKLQPKRSGARWLVRLQGPSAAVGRWVAHEPSSSAGAGAGVGRATGGDERWWRWDPDAGEADPFHKEQGSWFFFGLAPNFQERIWSFASSAPELGFYYKGESYGSKCVLRKDGWLEVARDSAAALSVLPLIRRSFDRTVVLKPVEPTGPSVTSIPAEAPPVGAANGERDENPVELVPEDLALPEAPGGADVIVQAPGPTPVQPDIVIRAEAALSGDFVLEPPREPDELAAVFAAEPPGPSLSALALIYLASELVASSADLRARCDRYCDYLRAVFGGLRAELWVKGPEGGWLCVGTPDQGPGRFGDCARQGAGLRKQGSTAVQVLEVRPRLQDPIGLLVVGGRGARGIDPLYAAAAARACVGLVFGARARAQQVREAEAA